MSGKPRGPRGFSDETIIAKTGRPSAEWTALLDAWDAPAKGHTAMARWLVEEHGLDGWWAQAITVRYEWERGLKTDPVMPDDLLAALTQQPELKARFEALSPSHQREHIKWIEEARRPATRARRVESVLASLQTT